MDKTKSTLDCPKCNIFIYDGDKNHINCILLYTKETLKDKINSYYNLNENEYKKIYNEVLPPIHEGWPYKNKIVNTTVKYPDVFVYDIYWKQLWFEEFKTPLLFPKWDILIGLKNIINDDAVLEINTYPGMYGWLLSKIGCNIHSTNKDKIDDGYNNIDHIDINDAFKKYDKCNILLIVLNDRELNDNIDNFKGDTIIIIGQNRCFGKFKINGFNGYFFDETWEWINRVYIDSWFGIDDEINIYELISY